MADEPLMIVIQDGNQPIKKIALPNLADLVDDSLELYKDNALMVLVNQDPPSKWIKRHPFIRIEETDAQGQKRSVGLPYMPVERIEYLLSRIFTKWWLEIKSCQQIANSVVVTVRLYVINPVDGQTMWNDGIGAMPLQTDKDAGAIEWDKIKSTAVQMSAPAAESYAFKDAAEKFGKLFGKDLTRKEYISYDSLLKDKTEPATLADICSLYNDILEAEQTKNTTLLTVQERADVERHTKDVEGKFKKDYNTTRTLLTKKLQGL